MEDKSVAVTFISEVIEAVEFTMKHTALDADEIVDFIMENIGDICKEHFNKQ